MLKVKSLTEKETQQINGGGNVIYTIGKWVGQGLAGLSNIDSGSQTAKIIRKN